MNDFAADDVDIVRSVASRDEFTIYDAVSHADGSPVRLTVFSSRVSQCAEFRRALKSNRAMLMMLQHQSVLRFLGSSESAGQLYFWTVPTAFQSLADRLKNGRRFSSEDVIEIGWQVCSALQQAHNLGLAHGGLSTDTILISDNLQVMLSDFGVARWLKAAADAGQTEQTNAALITVSTLASREEVEKDLNDLALVLSSLLRTEALPDAGNGGFLASASPVVSQTSTDQLLERLLTRLTDERSPTQLSSAREFQGRLGEILIGPGDDAMPLVDQRESPGTSRRSIVVQLFEPPESLDESERSDGSSAGTARGRQILPLILVVVVIVLITLLAGLFR
ncbi:MAG: protein kinase domain-containing protein [Planctomycetota bacterium]